MQKSFHALYNPEFESQFNIDKSHLRLLEDEDHHPRLLELIEDLGMPSNEVQLLIVYLFCSSYMIYIHICFQE